MENNAHVVAVKTTQEAIPELGKEAKTLYYLQIKTTKGAITMNVGKVTYEEVNRLTGTDLKAKKEGNAK